jgi:hypothetical protein
MSYLNLFINDQNYGSYLIIEDLNEQFTKSRWGKDGNDYPLYKCYNGLRFIGTDPEIYKNW